jgi:hypothetical protein
MQSNSKQQTISSSDATQAIKPGTMRYVLGFTLLLTTIAGMVIWNLFAS